MKQTKKIIAIGLSLGMVLTSIPVSASDYITADQWSEDVEGISESSEGTENEALEDISEPAEEIGSEDLEEFSAPPEEFSAPVEEDESLEAASAQSEAIRVSGKCGENITFQLTTAGVLTLSGSGAMPTITYDWKEYEPNCGWGGYISSIKKIIIEDGITSVSQYSFYDCENLTEVSIPSSIKSIGYEAFHWCHNVNKVMISGLDSWCDIDFENENSNPLQFGADLYINGKKETQIKIPEGITEMKPYVFGRSWTNAETKVAITSIQLPNTVTSIGKNAFAYNYLQSINIPNSVITIGEQAFAGNNFSAIEISEKVSVIESGAFKDCKKLQKIKIPDTAKNIGTALFANCIKLTDVKLPQGIETITEGLFAGCTSLEQFSVPDTVQLIEDYAFSRCNNLTNIKLPNQIHAIGNYAFYECSALNKINLPVELKSIGNSSFGGCMTLMEVIVPDGVTDIGEGAFSGCKALSKITMPDTVTEIGRTAFYNCCMLEQFKIPENIKVISDYTFYGCSKLSSITLSPNLVKIGESAFQNCVALENILIPESVTEIGRLAFSGCEKFENVILPSLIGEISASIFSGCKSLKEIQIPKSVTAIKENAFQNCNSLSEITIPEAVAEIGSNAFQNCSALNRINFKGNAPQIGTNAFMGVTADCYYPADNATYTLEITTQDWGGNLTWTYEGKTEEDDKYKCGENLTWNLTEAGKLIISGSGRMFDYSIDEYQYAPWYEERAKITSIEIDDNVTYIGNYAFYLCYKITDEKTKLPEKLEEIGEGAFKNCKIKSVDLPSMLKSVGKEAFAWSGLISVSLPSSLQCLSERMFAESHYLNEVTFAKGLREIGKESFYCCFGLNSVDIPEGVTSVADKAFAWCGAYKSFGSSYSCYNFRKVTLPSTLSTIGASAFSNCQVLQSINIPEGITEIQDNTFECCYELSGIIIPKGIKKIGNNAFSQNRSLKTITFSWNAPQIDSKAFGDGRNFPGHTTSTCYYPSNNSVWTSSMLQNYGGKLTWVAKEMVKPSGGAESDTGNNNGSNNNGSDNNGSNNNGSDNNGSDNNGSNNNGSDNNGSNNNGNNNSGSNSSESGNTGGTGTEKEFGFSAHSLTLNGDIGVNFYLELDKTIINDPNAVMEMEVAGRKKTTIKISDSVKNGPTEVEDTKGNKHSCYKFTCNVYAKQMTDNIVATLKTSSGTWKEVYSIQSYIEKAKDSSNEKLKNLMNAMVVYGGYAQMLFGYNINKLAGGSLGDVSGVTKNMLVDYKYTKEGKEENLSIYGASLLLKEQTTLRMYYKLAERNTSKYIFKIDGEEVQPIQSGDSNIYYIELSNIIAPDLDKPHTFTAGNINVSNYSALSYVNMALDNEKSSENNKKTAAALYLYWKAAEEYFS